MRIYSNRLFAVLLIICMTVQMIPLDTLADNEELAGNLVFKDNEAPTSTTLSASPKLQTVEETSVTPDLLSVPTQIYAPVLEDKTSTNSPIITVTERSTNKQAPELSTENLTTETPMPTITPLTITPTLEPTIAEKPTEMVTPTETIELDVTPKLLFKVLALSEVLYGDVNGDRKVDSADYTLLRKYLLRNISVLPAANWQVAGDLNLDKTMNSADYTILRKYLLKIIQSLPYGNTTITPTVAPTIEPTIEPTIDPLAPKTPTNLTATNVSGFRLNLSWTASDSDESIMYYDVYSGDEVVKTLGSLYTQATISGLTPNTNYSFKVKARSESGKESAYSNIVNVTTKNDDYSDVESDAKVLHVGGDTISGVINDAEDKDVFAFSPEDYSYYYDFNIETDSNQPIKVELIDASYIAYMPTDITYGMPYLQKGEKYYIFIKSTSFTEPVKYTIKLELPGPRPLTNVVLEDKTITTVKIKWDTPKTFTEIKYYDIYRKDNYGKSKKVATVTDSEFEDTGLVPNMTYGYRVDAIDFQNKTSYGATIESLKDQITVTTDEDNIAPSKPVNLKVPGKTLTTASLSWDASTDNAWVAGYDIYRDGVQVNSALVTETSYIDTGLSPGGIYTYTVEAIDISGNKSDKSAEFFVKIDDDTEPPTIPSNLVATFIKGSSAMLSWDASTDNLSIMNYDVCIGDIIYQTVTTNSVVVAGLTPKTLYNVKIRARDTSGYVSDYSNIFKLTTTAGDSTAAINIDAEKTTLYNMNTLNDQDWFSFTPKTNGVYTITGKGTKVKLYGTLYDNNLKTIISNNNECIISSYLESAKVYYLKVGSKNDVTGSYEISVNREKPDLIVTDIMPYGGNINEPILFSAKIENQGKESVPANSGFRVGFSIGDTTDVILWTNECNQEIDPEGSLTLIVSKGVNGNPTWTSGEIGDKKITAIVDDNGKVVESDDTNNSLTKSIPVGNLSDLVITDISFSPQEVKEGEEVEFKITVKNIGKYSTPLDSNFQGYLKIDNNNRIDFDECTLQLDPGQAATLISTGSTWKGIAGEHILTAVVNEGDSIFESNSKNNNYSEKMIVEYKPDLVITDISLSLPNPIVGDKIVFQAKVNNNGAGASPVGRIHRVGFWVDYSPIEIWSDSFAWSIEPNGSAIVTATYGKEHKEWIATEGQHKVSAKVDDAGIIAESNENNNSLTKNFTVTTERAFDSEADYDSDGLKNSFEMNIGTSITLSDTDGDGISDADEVNAKFGYKTDPINYDTDGDGISDGIEVDAELKAKEHLEINPLVADERVEKIKVASTQSDSVAVSVYGDVNILAAPLKVVESENILLNSLQGLTGKPVEISAGKTYFDSAKVTFKYDKTKLAEGDEDKQTVYWVDKESRKLVPVPQERVTINKDTQTITAEVYHFSTYVPGYDNMDVNISTADVVFCVDQSGSMSSSDPNFYRLSAIKRFVEGIDTTKVKIGITEFSNTASIKQVLTSNKDSIKSTLKNMSYNLDFTDIYDGVEKSRDVINDGSGKKKIIVVLTDGEHNQENYSKSDILKRAKELKSSGIMINAVGLGSYVDRQTVQGMADNGGGFCYYIQKASDIELLYSKLMQMVGLKSSDDTDSDEIDTDSDGPITPTNIDWDGKWLTNDGVASDMNFMQIGTKRVVGTYTKNGAKIDGTIDGNKIIGNWMTDSGEGTFTFLLSRDGSSYLGSWITQNGTSNEIGNVAAVRYLGMEQYSDWSGTWITDDGAGDDFYMELDQDGNNVSGKFIKSGGQISGTVSGNILYGTWKDDYYSGPFSFRLTDSDNESYIGYWLSDNLESIGVWIGTKVGTSFNGNFGGEWTTLDNSNIYDMTINQTGSSVSGEYDVGYRNGKVTGTVTGNKMTGTWSQADGSSGNYGFVLSSSGMIFDGIWVDNNGNGNWNFGTWNGMKKTYTIEEAYSKMTEYINGDNVDYNDLQSAIEFASKNGKYNKSYLPALVHSDRWDYNKYDDYILAWTNYWNYALSLEYNNGQVDINPVYIKAIMYTESRMGKATTHNANNDVMQALFPGDNSFWTQSKIDYTKVKGYQKGSSEYIIPIIKTDGQQDYASCKSPQVLQNIIKDGVAYGIPSTGFEILKSVLNKDSNSVYINYNYNNVTPNISIAFGIRWYELNLAMSGQNNSAKAIKAYNGGGDANYFDRIGGINEALKLMQQQTLQKP